MGRAGGDPPAEDYWPTIIAAVRATHPTLVFIAEAYWDMEWTLQQQGFDFCYDKRLYDRLVSGPAESVRGHLQAATDYQEGLLRFIENHDEPRAADTFAPEQQRAVAVVMSTLEGARMYHAGQLEGLHTHIPVFLARGPRAVRRSRAARVLREAARRGRRLRSARRGMAAVRVQRLARQPDGSSRARLVLARERRSLPRRREPRRARTGRRRFTCRGATSPGAAGTFEPLLDGDAFERDGDELRDQGLYVGMRPWESYFFALTA